MATVVCDDAFTLWVNGQKVGSGEGGKPYRFSLNGIVGRGTNVLGIEAGNRSGPAGLLVEAEIRTQGGKSIRCDSGPDWLVTRMAPEDDGWLQPGFDGAAWSRVQVLGKHGETPWKEISLSAGNVDRFQVAGGFAVKQVAGHDLVGSLIAMTWGNRNRLIASRERGPIISVIDDDGDGDYDRVAEYSTSVENCQGLCVVFDDLYAVGSGPQGVGLYRLPDKDHDDRADEVVLVVNQKGVMNDHGPHSVTFGPDGWLYHCLGNRSWIVHPPERESACHPWPDWEEGYLLEPAYEDPRGHVVGIKAPGGTIWRFAPDGKRWWTEAAGFRNHYDIAFNSRGDLFTFDSDMEWDENLPWYRPVRINHCIPGADFGWRSGAKNGPAWYFDSLTPTVDVGRGSPTGVLFYEHTQFPEKYRGAMLNCDWSMGRIIAARLRPEGATYAADIENLVTGNPLNVSDIEVDRDGSVVFCVGGRKTEGGIYRLSYLAGASQTAKAPRVETLEDALALPQPQAAWNREAAATLREKLGDRWQTEVESFVRSGTSAQKIRALTLLAQQGPKPEANLLLSAAADSDAVVRQFALLLLGEHQSADVARTLTTLLDDPDPVVRRRACEAFVRSGLEPPVEPLLRLISSDDRWLRFAARVALEPAPVERWKEAVLRLPNVNAKLTGLLALHRKGPPALSADEALGELAPLAAAALDEQAAVDMRRLLQLVLTRLERGGPEYARIRAAFGQTLVEELTRKTLEGGGRATASPLMRENAELVAWLDAPGAAEALVRALDASRDDHPTQTHYVLCLRYVRDGWTDEVKSRLLDWYETAHAWEGGHSLHGYLRNILSGCFERFTFHDRKRYILAWRERPHAARLLLASTRPDDLEGFHDLARRMLTELENSTITGRQGLLTEIVDALSRSRSSESQGLLRKMFDENTDERDLLARALAKNPVRENVPVYLRGISSGDRTTSQLCLQALSAARYSPSKPGEFRTVIVAGLKLGDQGGKAALKVLRKWVDKAPPGEDLSANLAFYQQWFVETFPDQPAPELLHADADKLGYSVPELVAFLDSPQGSHGDVARGRQVFIKANCAKCHRFQQEGEGVGPDLSSLRRRFQKKEIVESILLPSQVVSDQFTGVTIVTKDGLVYTGMPVQNPEPKVVELLLSDGTKLQIPKQSIEEQKIAEQSVMPEGLLKPLSLAEIADLFAYLETSKNAADRVADMPMSASSLADQ